MIPQHKLLTKEKVTKTFLNKHEQQDCRFDTKWIEVKNRVFSIYPSYSLVQGNKAFIMRECWIELACFVRDDLQWLLSLEHHIFWSHMIYSKNAHNLLISFLKESPPNYMRNSFLMDEEMNGIFKEIEHLVFLVFLRLSTEKESENCFIENLGEILYNNYLFTVPILLDICIIYGTSNHELVKSMINRIINMAPNFLIDLEEVVPQFFHVLSVVKENFLTKHWSKIGRKMDLEAKEITDLVVYLYDSVVTVQIFLDLFRSGCSFFCQNDLLNEMITFYSNVLPEIKNEFERNCNAINQAFVFKNLVENIHIDILKIVKSIFDYVASEADKSQNKNDELIDKYLSLMMELLSESAFLYDYNELYSIRFEIESVTQKCVNVDFIKVNHILEGVTLTLKDEKIKRGLDKYNKKEMEKSQGFEVEISGMKLNSLITKVHDILPHLTEDFIKDCLKYYKYDTEKAISAVLENCLPPGLRNVNSNIESISKAGNGLSLEWNESVVEPEFEYEGKHKSKHGNLKDILNDKTEINEMREWYKQFEVVTDEMYDDEYDDTYDENVDVFVRDGDEPERSLHSLALGDSDKSDEEEDEALKVSEQNRNQDLFLQNPAELREQNRINKKWEVVRGGSQNKQRSLNTHFKEANKSLIGNHDRKKQASRKKKQGMIPS